MKDEHSQKADQLVVAWMENPKPVMGDLVDAIATALRDAHARGMNAAPLQKELAAFNSIAIPHQAHHYPLAGCPFCAMCTR